MRKADVVILGGGAAGLMCAMRAGRRGRTVIVLEHNSTVAEKIRISGGGRCNFTNTLVTPAQFLSDNPDFVHSSLARFTPADFLALVREHGIPHEERADGQLFCLRSARDIIALLLDECEAAGVQIIPGVHVDRVSRTDRFTVETSAGAYSCASLVIATGGLSIPPLGASDLGYRIARQFGLRIVQPRPGLVPFRLAGSEHELAQSLAGVSIDCRVTIEGTSFEGSMLFTHAGVSGPPILQISSYWREGMPIAIDLLPVDFCNADRCATFAGRTVAGVLADVVPKRAARAFAALAGIAPAVKWSPQSAARIAEVFMPWHLHPSGTLGYAKAEVTVGGVDTRDLSSKTMMARSVPGLYFIGEVVDVTGWLGGYNFQWAWASGAAAGDAA